MGSLNYKMATIDTLKLQTYNSLKKETQRQVTSNLSQLNANLDKAIIQQAYVRKNPDNLIDAEYLASLSVGFTELETVFMILASKITDMKNVQSETMTADELISKYSVDLTEFSNSLL